jgi:hypothetical protein
MCLGASLASRSLCVLVGVGDLLEGAGSASQPLDTGVGASAAGAPEREGPGSPIACTLSAWLAPLPEPGCRDQPCWAAPGSGRGKSTAPPGRWVRLAIADSGRPITDEARG